MSDQSGQPTTTGPLDDQISQWREFVRRRRAVHNADVEELEDHLRAQIDELTEIGLAPDEAFLVAVKRMGNLDAVSHEFAQEHSDRLWKQLVLPGHGSVVGSDSGPPATTELGVVLALAVAAAVTTALLVNGFDDENLIARLFAVTVLPFLAAYFAWKRQVEPRLIAAGGAVIVVGTLAAGLYPFEGPDFHTSFLTALHLPIVLWFVVGLAYVAGRWRDADRRMDFIRFTGEVAIYYALLGLGGGVLLGVTVAVFDSIDVDLNTVVGQWILPAGVAGAALVAAWLVEAKQGVIEAMAPVLTRVFSPLFTLVFVIFLVTMLFTGRGFDVDRDVLILFDLLLVVVLGLVLYSISARDPEAPPGWFDYLQLALIVSALAIDLLGLGAILSRISEFGFSANKTAALGENLVLMVNLAVSAWLYLRFIQGRRPFRVIEQWQTSYLILFPIWAAIVVLAFPPLFDFV